jgi:hypothetical protein
MVFLMAWFAATTVHQIRGLRRWTRLLDINGMLLPLWTFFAPIPGTQDSELVFRTFDDGGHPSAWVHLPVYQLRRRSHFILQPNRRLEKTVFDAVGALRVLTSRSSDADKNLVTSPPYLVLLSVVISKAPVPADAVAIQYMLIQSGGHDDGPRAIQPIFVSARHGIQKGKQ